MTEYQEEGHREIDTALDSTIIPLIVRESVSSAALKGKLNQPQADEGRSRTRDGAKQ